MRLAMKKKDLVMCLGLAVGLRSLTGIAITAFLFFPSAIYRGGLEEAALPEKFGVEWKA